MRFSVMTLVLAISVQCAQCHTIRTDGAKALITRAKTLIAAASSGSREAQAVSKYEEPLMLLDRAWQLCNKDPELYAQIELLRATCYDGQAKYFEEREALKRWADLASKGNKEKAARLMMMEADECADKNERSEAIALYRLIARRYPHTEAGPGALFKATRILEEDARKYGGLTTVALEYENLLARYPHSQSVAEITIVLSDVYLSLQKRDRAINLLAAYVQDNPGNECSTAALSALADIYWNDGDKGKAISLLSSWVHSYPDGKQSPAILWKLAGLYQGIGDLTKAKEVLETYQRRYPKGEHGAAISFLLSAISRKTSKIPQED